MQLHIRYPSKSKPSVFSIHTPLRKHTINSLARCSYSKAAATSVKCKVMSSKILLEVTRKIKRELQDMSSDDHGSILRDTNEAVKRFSWETAILELQQNVPTLIKFIQLLVPRPLEKKPLICFIASLLLKARHQQLCLVQRAVSVMLYGNGVGKQVHNVYVIKVFTTGLLLACSLYPLNMSCSVCVNSSH